MRKAREGTPTKQADSGAMMPAREKRLPKRYGAEQKNLTDDVLHRVGPIHRAVRLWSHNGGGSCRNAKDVQKETAKNPDSEGTNQCAAFTDCESS